MTNNNTQNIQIPTATMTKEQHDKLIADMNIPKILEDNKEKLENAVLESMANERASLEPLPDIMDEVYDLEHNLVVTLESGAQVKVRKMVALDLTIFKLTNSPFYNLMMGDIDNKDGSADVIRTLFPDEELFFNLVYQFVNDVKYVYREVRKDIKAYHDNAVEEIGSSYSTADLLKIVEAIFKYIEKVNGARVSITATESGDDNKKKQ